MNQSSTILVVRLAAMFSLAFACGIESERRNVVALIGFGLASVCYAVAIWVDAQTDAAIARHRTLPPSHRAPKPTPAPPPKGK